MMGTSDVGSDLIIIGGGIVGLSTAIQAQAKFPELRITLLEKEAGLAHHQTGRNSGVIHAGVYYAPGTLKARFCREGAAATLDFCRRHGLPVDQCGKLIVATDERELLRLDDLQQRCVANGLSPIRFGEAELNQLEPRIIGRAAIRIASSGIADYPAITRKMAELVTAQGAAIQLGCEVLGLRESGDGIIVETARGAYRARHAIVCGGLMADRLMAMCGLEPDFRIVPFRGEYYRLPASKNEIVRHLIYPTPDPALPFLGVHLTRMIGGYVTVGPNAVLALAREGYAWRDINLRDLADLAAFPGFWKLIAVNAKSGSQEMANSVFRRGYLAQCRKYCPELTLDDLEPHPSGVRAQAVLRDGSLVHDFLIRRGRRTLHVCNAPSPAATSAIPIGRHLVETFAAWFGDEIGHTVDERSRDEQDQLKTL
jgi:L-2-hydroxyglutarate oxidase